MDRRLLTPLISGWLAFWVVLWFERRSVWFAQALASSRAHPWMPWLDALPAAVITGTVVGVLMAVWRRSAPWLAAAQLITRAAGERSLERGLRRIVLLVSLVICAASLSAARLEVSAVAQYHVTKRAYEQREETFQAWLAQHPISEARVAAARARLSPQEKFYEQYVDVARENVTRELRWEHARQNGLEAFLNPPDARRPWWTWPLSWVVSLGLGVTAGLTALPWGVFYLLRWIVRGFLP